MPHSFQSAQPPSAAILTTFANFSPLPAQIKFSSISIPFKFLVLITTPSYPPSSTGYWTAFPLLCIATVFFYVIAYHKQIRHGGRKAPLANLPPVSREILSAKSEQIYIVLVHYTLISRSSQYDFYTMILSGINAYAIYLPAFCCALRYKENSRFASNENPLRPPQ